MPVNTLALDRLYNLTVEKYDRACTNSSGRNKGGKTDLRKVVLLSYARSKLENYTEDDAHIYDFLETMRGEDHEKEETFTGKLHLICKRLVNQDIKNLLYFKREKVNFIRLYNLYFFFAHKACFEKSACKKYRKLP